MVRPHFSFPISAVSIPGSEVKYVSSSLRSTKVSPFSRATASALISTVTPAKSW